MSACPQAAPERSHTSSRTPPNIQTTALEAALLLSTPANALRAKTRYNDFQKTVEEQYVLRPLALSLEEGKLLFDLSKQ